MHPRDLPLDAAGATIMDPKPLRVPHRARPALTLAANCGRAYAPWVDTVPVLPQLLHSTLPGDSGFPTTQPQPREVAPRIPRIAARRSTPLLPAITSAMAGLVASLAASLIPHRVRLHLATRRARREAEHLEWLLRWRASLPGKLRRQEARYHEACNAIDAMQSRRARAELAKAPARHVIRGH